MTMRTIARYAGAPALLLGTLACEGSTGPEPHRELAINTMAVSLRGGTTNFDGVVEARAFFQHVTNGQGTGLRIEAEPGGHPLVIHVPGAPTAGSAALGPWDPLTNYRREDTIPVFVGRTPSVSLGGWPAASLGAHTVQDGVILLESVRLPMYREFADQGRIRGSLQARSVADVGSPSADSVDITADFLVEVFGLHDGRAEATFAGPGVVRSAPNLIGGGNTYHRDGFPSADPQLVILLSGEFADSRERVWIWFGTKLTGPGQVAVEAFDLDSIFTIRHWPDHFVAGVIGEPSSDGRMLVAVDGMIEFDVFEEEEYSPVQRWGVAKGRLTVELEVRNTADGVDRTTAVITFDVPRFWVVSVESGPPPAQVFLPPGPR